MATKDTLVKGWIQYLKNNRIVELEPAPDGKLRYKRHPTEAELVQYLQVDFTDEEISAAFANARRSISRKKNVAEDFTETDKPVSEAFAAAVFSAILRVQASALKKQEQEITSQKKIATIERIRQIVSEMNSDQRTALLSALRSITAAPVPEDISEKVDFSRLVQGWKNSNYPKTLGSLKGFLSKAGYSVSDIKNSLKSYFGSNPGAEPEQVDNAPAIDKIVTVIKTAGIEQEIIDMLEQDFGVKESEIEYMGIKTILESMSLCVRREYLRSVELSRLGKNKKD